MVVAERLVPNRVEVVNLVDVVRWTKRKDARAFRARDRKHFLVRIKIARVPLCTIAEKFHRDLVCRTGGVLSGGGKVLKTVEIIGLFAQLQFEIPVEVFNCVTLAKAHKFVTRVDHPEQSVFELFP